MNQARTHEASARIAQEIAQEKAAAFGRAGERLQAALDEALAPAARVRAPAGPAARATLVRDYDVARARVRAARFALLVQREAIGLRQHRVVEQHFPEPAPLT